MSEIFFSVLKSVFSIALIVFGTGFSIFLRKHKNWFSQEEQTITFYKFQIYLNHKRLRKVRKNLIWIGNILILLGFYYLLSK